MCLDIVWTKEKQRAWLAKKPSNFEVYKSVVKRDAKSDVLAPQYYYDRIAFAPGENVAPRMKMCEWVRRRTYTPYFHFWVSKKKWQGFRQMVCTVRKRDVTAIGRQDGKIVVVARRFAISEKAYKKALYWVWR
jgi:hypothetical protein